MDTSLTTSVPDAAEMGPPGWRSMVDALEQALRAGLDPEADPPRSRVTAEGCELLLMPSRMPGWTGAKLITLAEDNPGRGLPLVQGIYVLFEADGGTPTAILDGAALTAVRTPAVSALAVRHLATKPVERVALLGTGVQGAAHSYALLATTGAARLDVIGRTPERVAALARSLGGPDAGVRPAGIEAVAKADLVICTTGSATPLFAGDAVRPDAVVVAIGSHTPDTREVDTALAARSSVVVESRQSALRENGDVVLPLAEGAIAESDLLTLADVVTGRVVLPTDRPRLFTGTGMPWQDLVAAAALARPTTIMRTDHR
ncbi:ornithine cyclodeaminase family protein [Pseudonocardia oroxyli]|uniref:Ornithine cyclodeaminase n=1 Tax=Pseudonocardia oroxyli TaxID=366584 RepID=A0A1G7SSH1_PSEOR|nr:ornithine cyclodeaminase family protein [Pseudonocardia oroxyli]SDG26037.1 ornithine cyclodeaminase [Pseudonocardia oroxyli]